MESVLPPGSPKQVEGLQQEEIVLKEIIRPFARGLFQMAAIPLQELESGFSSLPNENNVQTQEVIAETQSALNNIATTLRRLQTAKEVKIARYTEGTKEEYRLIFSEELEEEEIPPKGEAEPPPLPVVRAVFDRLGNELAEVVVGIHLLSNRRPNKDIKEKMEALNASANKIKNDWGSLQEPADYKVKISTDAQGNTTITPIPRPTPQP